MATLFLFLVLALNFGISWSNAKAVGRYWSESKVMGKSFRIYVIVGYIMSIAGFTMVYGYILLLVSPIILELLEMSPETILSVQQLSSDLIYLLCVITIFPIGFYVWFMSVKNFFEKKTLGNGLVAGYNTFAQLHNTMNVARNAPSAFGRVVKTLFGGNSKKKDNTVIILCAILILILAIFGGYFTASAIMKKADREYDMFAKPQYQSY